jgi:hypothetical protein
MRRVLNGVTPQSGILTTTIRVGDGVSRAA